MISLEEDLMYRQQRDQFVAVLYIEREQDYCLEQFVQLLSNRERSSEGQTRVLQDFPHLQRELRAFGPDLCMTDLPQLRMELIPGIAQLHETGEDASELRQRSICFL